MSTHGRGIVTFSYVLRRGRFRSLSKVSDSSFNTDCQCAKCKTEIPLQAVKTDYSASIGLMFSVLKLSS